MYRLKSACKNFPYHANLRFLTFTDSKPVKVTKKEYYMKYQFIHKLFTRHQVESIKSDP